MRRLLRVLTVASLLVIVVPVGAVAAFDALWFYPRLTHVRMLVVKGHPEDRNTPRLVEELVVASEPNGLSWQVARIVIFQGGEEYKHTGTLRWNLLGSLSQLLVNVHTSESERMATYCSLVYSGETAPGLTAIARRLHNKSLSSLSLEEAADVAAWSFAPHMFAASPERLEKRRELLIRRYRGGI